MSSTDLSYALEVIASIVQANVDRNEDITSTVSRTNSGTSPPICIATKW